ncbi:MAG TPA: 2,3,4,5-tetrahydropyridine-2,6-dicarboxylate N-succinyltransferase [Candidatus Acidoferrales bacterium]|jgi:2,3,4,5-tetrahydropyridine-2-carboxylate N-succinyltransferase|nr:2,3,4,5-tetrahydropyridine-2,6-dicarboxylate N-succinyltransferase [Candidatus Acidoferrales bacterium]
MPPADMKSQIERLFDENPPSYTDEQRRLFQQFKDALNAGEIRAAEPNPATPTGWSVNAWVKKGILLGFRMGAIVDMSIDVARQPFFDKSTYPTKTLTAASGVRIVPGGSSIRDACYIAKGVTCMPPMYVNVGAYVDEGTMIDSHALVGSCAQIGKKCHISAASQIGGVLEPVGAMPVIVEDDVLIGGNCGVYEGTVVKRRAVLGTGTILNRSTPVYDVVTGAVHSAAAGKPLVIPENAVMVAGSRAISHGRGKDWNLSLYTPVIVKYRDAKTDAKVQLEDLLR